MKKYLLGLTILSTLILTACFGEDYDVGVPTAALYTPGVAIHKDLTESNVNWSSSDGDVKKEVQDLQAFTKDLPYTYFPINEQVQIDFRENKKNGGDIWTDPSITAYLIAEDSTITQLKVSDTIEVTLPSTPGNYTFVTKFSSQSGRAEYVGNIILVE